ncbi:TPA: HNH endonuclease [Burkholderia vietnamiensis]|nr:HNH endonuclease [Burkholderia vietnamiensis]
MNRTCALCTASLNNKTQSKEHIIPNSIGGRRKTKLFICKECNNKFGETWDAELAKQLNWCALTLGISRERGEVPAQVVQTIEGQKLWLKNDGTMTPESPAYREDKVGDQTQINISARTIDEAKRMLNGVGRKYPSFDKEKALQELRVVETYLDSPIHVDLGIGGPEVGRSIVKTAFAHACDSGVAHKYCDKASKYLADPNAAIPYGFAMLSDLVRNRPTDGLFHCVALIGDPKKKRLLSYIEYFGLFRILVDLSSYYSGPAITATYAIDPILGDALRIDIDWTTAWSQERDILSGGGYSEEEYRRAADYAIPMLMQKNEERHRERVVKDAFIYAAESLGIPKGENIPMEKRREFVDFMMEKISPYINHLVMRGGPT